MEAAAQCAKPEERTIAKQLREARGQTDRVQGLVDDAALVEAERPCWPDAG